MTPVSRCPRCGATIPPGRQQCPACVFELGLEREVASDAESESPSRARERRGPPPAIPELAADFPQLEILELVGEGGMGIVYRARHKQLGREVALKILAGELADDPRFEERFLREARALARLDHPGIVRVHDFGRAGKRWFLLMEFVDGTSLRALIKEKRLGSREALTIVPQICEALQFAHDEGVVHRDVKPENVLVDSKGRVKLADFGLAKLVGVENEPRNTATGTVVGTAHYIAPEQIAHPREVDHRADIYSLGVVFYEMLTGELPLGRFEPPSKRVQVDVRLDEIVLKSLERAPERRYQHAVEVKTDVDEVASRPAAPARAAAKQAQPPTSRETTVKCLLFALAWCGVLGAFDLGPAAFIASMTLPLLVAVYAQRCAVARGEIRWTPIRAAIAVGSFPVGFALFFAGGVALFDQNTSFDGSGYESGFADVYRSLVYGLEPIRATLVEQAGGADVAPGRRRVLTDLDLPGLWRQRWFVLAGLAIWFVALSLPSWRRRSFALVMDGSHAITALCVACVPLVAVLFLMRIGSSLVLGPISTRRMTAIEDRWTAPAGAEDVATRARVALLAIGYQVHTEVEIDVVVADKAEKLPSTPKLVRVMHADQPDVFERMCVTWRGPQRARPTVNLYLCELNDGTTVVVPSLGSYHLDKYVPSPSEWFAPRDALAGVFRYW